MQSVCTRRVIASYNFDGNGTLAYHVQGAYSQWESKLVCFCYLCRYVQYDLSTNEQYVSITTVQGACWAKTFAFSFQYSKPESTIILLLQSYTVYGTFLVQYSVQHAVLREGLSSKLPSNLIVRVQKHITLVILRYFFISTTFFSNSDGLLSIFSYYHFRITI